MRHKKKPRQCWCCGNDSFSLEAYVVGDGRRRRLSLQPACGAMYCTKCGHRNSTFGESTLPPREDDRGFEDRGYGVVAYTGASGVVLIEHLSHHEALGRMRHLKDNGSFAEVVYPERDRLPQDTLEV